MKFNENVFRQSLTSEALDKSWAFVLFGATGDLSRRKILPSLYGLFHYGLVPDDFNIVGFASSDISQNQYRQMAADSIRSFAVSPVSDFHLDRMLANISYEKRDGDGYESYERLSNNLQTHLPNHNRLFFMAVPAEVAVEHAQKLAATGLNNSNITRIVVEKPFGHDRNSSSELNSQILKVFPEDSIYRIDHYLGKETVQNILVIRFANQFIEPLLNNNHVDNIQITIAETVGVERRGTFYDSTGALRDMIQNHALQMLALLTMERPGYLRSEDIRKAKAELLNCISIPDLEKIDLISATGRYAGKEPYLSEPGIRPGSTTETFAAIKLDIDNHRWSGVPMFIRTGKKLAKKATAITVGFHESCPISFGELSECSGRPNYLTIMIQPDEGLSLTMETKLPGQGFRTRPISMDFRYNKSIVARVPEAYERLILDALMGDRTNFSSAEEIDLMWGICEPFFTGWKSGNIVPEDYLPGTWGPASSDELITRSGRKWRRL